MRFGGIASSELFFGSNKGVSNLATRYELRFLHA